MLAELTAVNWWARLRGREPAWRVLHSVPLGDGQGRIRGDVDHLMVGPPGVVTINSKHHRGGRLALHGEQLVLNGHPTAYVQKARREADRVRHLLAAALAVCHPELLERATVRSMIAIVGGRLLVTAWAPGVTVVKTSQLIHALTSLPARLDPDEVDRVHELARRSTTWNPPGAPITDR